MYKDALDFLSVQHIIYRVNQLEKEQQFKVFFPDFSFISSARNDELTVVECQNRIHNYLCQTLFQNGIECYFWESKSQASIDFVIKKGDSFLPIELKAEGKSKSKSIHSFANQYVTEHCIRITTSNFSENEEVFAVPVYSLFCFKNDD